MDDNENKRKYLDDNFKKFNRPLIFTNKNLSLLQELKKNASKIDKSFFTNEVKKQDEYLNYIRIFDQVNFDAISKTWQSGIFYINILNIILLDIGIYFNQTYKKNIKDWSFISLLSRINKVTKEIILLMENGYSDGAYARYRTLFELEVVVAFFTKHNNEELYQMYYDHGLLNYYRREKSHIEKYSKNEKNEKEYKKMEAKVKSFQYNMKCFNKDFGWTYTILGENVDFYNLCKYIGIEERYYVYKDSCKVVHADANGTYQQISDIDIYHTSHHHATNYGQHIVGKATAISLKNIATSLINLSNIPFLKNGVDLVNIYEEKAFDNFTKIQLFIEKE